MLIQRIEKACKLFLAFNQREMFNRRIGPQLCDVNLHLQNAIISLHSAIIEFKLDSYLARGKTISIAPSLSRWKILFWKLHSRRSTLSSITGLCRLRENLLQPINSKWITANKLLLLYMFRNSCAHDFETPCAFRDEIQLRKESIVGSIVSKDKSRL